MPYARWPGSGETLTLQVHGRAAPLVATVDEVGDGWIRMREPYDPAGALVDEPPPGSRLLLQWTNAAGKHSCEGVLSGVRLDRVPLWIVPVQHGPTVQQRREFVRVADLVPVVLVVGEHREEGIVCDLSEGGARCVLVGEAPAGAPMVVGEELGLELALDGHRVTVRVELLELTTLGDSRRELRLRFRGLGGSGDVLRRHLIAQQYRARAVRR